MILEAQQDESLRWAASHVVAWGKLDVADYDFKNSWAKDLRHELLIAGCAYEYARESHKFRCLLVLSNKRKPEELRGRPAVIEFTGSSAGFEHLSASGWHRWLMGFADELIANNSFAKVFGTDPTRVRKSLDSLPGYSLFPKAVQLPGHHVNYPGSQIVEIEFCWRRYTDDDIGEEKKIGKKTPPACVDGAKTKRHREVEQHYVPSRCTVCNASRITLPEPGCDHSFQQNPTWFYWARQRYKC